jgi:hypothetical protein
VGTGFFVSGTKRRGRQANHTPPLSANFYYSSVPSGRGQGRRNFLVSFSVGFLVAKLPAMRRCYLTVNNDCHRLSFSNQFGDFFCNYNAVFITLYYDLHCHPSDEMRHIVGKWVALCFYFQITLTQQRAWRWSRLRRHLFAI